MWLRILCKVLKQEATYAECLVLRLVADGRLYILWNGWEMEYDVSPVAFRGSDGDGSQGAIREAVPGNWK